MLQAFSKALRIIVFVDHGDVCVVDGMLDLDGGTLSVAERLHPLS